MKINKEARFSDLICYTKLYKKSSGYFHWHERIEICQIFSPGCSFFIDGETVQTEPGDLVVMGEYEVHKFIIENDDSRIRLCQFPLNILFGAGCKIKPIKKHIPKSEIDTIPGLYDSITSIFDLMEKEHKNYEFVNSIPNEHIIIIPVHHQNLLILVLFDIPSTSNSLSIYPIQLPKTDIGQKTIPIDSTINLIPFDTSIISTILDAKHHNKLIIEKIITHFLARLIPLVLFIPISLVS